MTPAQMEEVKRSAARAGGLTTLTRAKAWIADLDPAVIAKGGPTMIQTTSGLRHL